MKNRRKPEIRTIRASGKYRDNSKLIANDLNDALATSDSAAITKKIGDMIRDYGSSNFARQSRLGRESLYNSFSGRAPPRFSRVLKVLLVLNLKLVVKPTAK